jgi:Abortive infection C-terminus
VAASPNSNKLPRPVLATLADALATAFTHRELDHLFDRLDAPQPGSNSWSNKEGKARAYLDAANLLPDPTQLVAGMLEELLDVALPHRVAYWTGSDEPPISKPVGMLRKAMEKAGLRYVDKQLLRVGSKTPGPPAKALLELLRAGNYDSVNEEFSKAEANTENDPREAVRASCAQLESLFKLYIEDTPELEMPAKQDLGSLWAIIRKRFNLNAAAVEDQDLQKVITGLGSIADGVGSLRTHASTAHGKGRKPYRIEPRHARLAVNSAHTLALFILETWTKHSSASEPK